MNTSNTPNKSRWKRLFRAELLSPVGFLAVAGLIMLAYGAVEAAGWREHTTFISGTTASADMRWQASAARGLAYMLVYFAFVLLAPILALAASFWAAGRRWMTN
jgi:hypothetical protein